MAENVAEIEAIADARREDPRIDIGVAHNVHAAERGVVMPSDGGVEPRLLHIEIQRPAVAKSDIDAGLEGEAEGVVDLDFAGAEDVVAGALVEEGDILHACADIRLPFAHAGEVVLQGERRREDPGVGDLVQAADRPLAVDLVLGEAAEQLGREILGEVVAERKRRDHLGADGGIGAGDDGAARAHGRVAVGIDHGAEHLDLKLAVVASGRGRQRRGELAYHQTQGC